MTRFILISHFKVRASLHQAVTIFETRSNGRQGGWLDQFVEEDSCEAQLFLKSVINNFQSLMQLRGTLSMIFD